MSETRRLIVKLAIYIAVMTVITAIMYVGYEHFPATPESWGKGFKTVFGTFFGVALAYIPWILIEVADYRMRRSAR